MIRKLTDEDNKKLMELVLREPEFNLYIIGDVENYGYTQEFQEIFGEFNKDSSLIAVMVRYFNIFTLYATDKFDVEGFASIIKNHDLGMLIGKTEIISKFQNMHLKLNRSEHHHFAVLRSINPDFKVDKNIIVKRAGIHDIDRIINLKNGIDEFISGSRNAKELLLNEFKSGASHGYYVEMDGKMVSYAQTSAENSMSAMIVSVMTDKKYRKKGLASSCIKALCNDLTKQQKTLCLFYKNPEAAAIYKKIGFTDIGLWSMYMH